MRQQKVCIFKIDPKKLKVNADKFDNLVGQDAKFNAEKMLNIFEGEDNDFSKAVCLNAAAGLVVSEKYENFKNLNLAFKKILKITNKKKFFYKTILFSPSAASFDTFKNFEDRGNYFNKLVKRNFSGK